MEERLGHLNKVPHQVRRQHRAEEVCKLLLSDKLDLDLLSRWRLQDISNFVGLVPPWSLQLDDTRRVL
jgi:hypothetical protein